MLIRHAYNIFRPTFLLIFAVLQFAACNSGESTNQSNTTQVTDPELIAKGEQLYLTLGCAQCHTKDGKRLMAPTFKGLYGKEEKLNDGSTIVVDADYIKESVLHPEAKIVAGYRPMHPPQAWDLDDETLNALVAFIHSLK